jgi:hypothetical protein
MNKLTHINTHIQIGHTNIQTHTNTHGQHGHANTHKHTDILTHIDTYINRHMKTQTHTYTNAKRMRYKHT